MASQYQELKRIHDEYLVYRAEYMAGKQKRHSRSFAANMLCFHPVVASRLMFKYISDKSEVPAFVGQDPLVDCTNASNDWTLAPPETGKEVSFSPQLHASAPGGLFKLPRSSGALHGQWSVAWASLSHVTSPNTGFDSRFPASGCLSQCHSVFYWATYHSVPQLFLGLQYAPTVVQMFVALIYHIVMQVLAITGFTWLFFNDSLYTQRPQPTPRQSIEIVTGRWKWFSDQTSYSGAGSQFPLSYDDIPGVPRCFSFDWIYRSRNTLRFRMFFTVLLIVLLSTYVNRKYLALWYESLPLSITVTF